MRGLYLILKDDAIGFNAILPISLLVLDLSLRGIIPNINYRRLIELICISHVIFDAHGVNLPTPSPFHLFNLSGLSIAYNFLLFLHFTSSQS